MAISLKSSLKKIAAPPLKSLGYELIELKEWVGGGSFFFRNHLWAEMYSFIEFHLMAWTPGPKNHESLSRRISVVLWRNHGDTPHSMYQKNDTAVDDWLYMPLSYLLWSELDIKVYGNPYFLWEFKTSDDLDFQLQNAVHAVIKYGIPWLENPASRGATPKQQI